MYTKYTKHYEHLPNVELHAPNDIVDNPVLPTLWQQIGESPFLFQHNIAPMHKARFIQKWFVEIDVEELNWPAQSPDLNSISDLPCVFLVLHDALCAFNGPLTLSQCRCIYTET